MFYPIVLVVSREEVEQENISIKLDILKTFVETPETAKTFMENIDIAFHGYKNDRRELWEIPEVRRYVQQLSNFFPYWLFFLSKDHLGLITILRSFTTPNLKEPMKTKCNDIEIMDLLVKLFFPAMNRVCDFVGMSDYENMKMTERVMLYIKTGPIY